MAGHRGDAEAKLQRRRRIWSCTAWVTRCQQDCRSQEEGGSARGGWRSRHGDRITLCRSLPTLLRRELGGARYGAGLRRLQQELGGARHGAETGGGARQATAGWGRLRTRRRPPQRLAWVRFRCSNHRGWQIFRFLGARYPSFQLAVPGTGQCGIDDRRGPAHRRHWTLQDFGRVGTRRNSHGTGGLPATGTLAGQAKSHLMNRWHANWTALSGAEAPVFSAILMSRHTVRFCSPREPRPTKMICGITCGHVPQCDPSKAPGSHQVIESVWPLGFGLCSARLQVGMLLNLKGRSEGRRYKNLLNPSCHTDSFLPVRGVS